MNQIVFALDSGFSKPTAVAMYSALASAKVPLRVHVMGYGLDDEEYDLFSRVAAAFPHICDLIIHRIQPQDLPLPKHGLQHISSASFLRLYIPEYIKGRVLYLDGDILVRKDLSDFLNTPLDGKLVGAVRGDSYVKIQAALDRVARSDTPTPEDVDYIARNKARIDLTRDVIGLERVGDVFNGGVLLMDTDAFRNTPQVYHAWQDLDGIVTKGQSRDQVWSNTILKDHVKLLPVYYNANWSVSKPFKAFVPEADWADWEIAKRDATIFHFTGKKKPWLPLNKCFSWNSRRYVFEFRKYLKKVDAISKAR